MTDARRFQRCFVPLCPNTMLNTPNKLFFSVPKPEEIRKKWFKVFGKRYTSMWGKASMHCCEDHFNVEDDIDNWMFYKTMSNIARFKKNVVPHLYLDEPLNDPHKTQFSFEERWRKENNLLKLKGGERNDKLESQIKEEYLIEESDKNVEIKKRKRGRPRKTKDPYPSEFVAITDLPPESIKEEVASDIDETVDIKCENLENHQGHQDPLKLQLVDKYVQTDEVACCCDHKNCAEVGAVKLLVINNGSTSQSLTFLNSTIT